jgi:hypothetical protein
MGAWTAVVSAKTKVLTRSEVAERQKTGAVDGGIFGRHWVKDGQVLCGRKPIEVPTVLSWARNDWMVFALNSHSES